VLLCWYAGLLVCWCPVIDFLSTSHWTWGCWLGRPFYRCGVVFLLFGGVCVPPRTLVPSSLRRRLWVNGSVVVAFGNCPLRNGNQSRLGLSTGAFCWPSQVGAFGGWLLSLRRWKLHSHSRVVVHTHHADNRFFRLRVRGQLQLCQALLWFQAVFGKIELYILGWLPFKASK